MTSEADPTHTSWMKQVLVAGALGAGALGLSVGVAEAASSQSGDEAAAVVQGSQDVQSVQFAESFLQETTQKSQSKNSGGDTILKLNKGHTPINREEAAWMGLYMTVAFGLVIDNLGRKHSEIVTPGLVMLAGAGLFKEGYNYYLHSNLNWLGGLTFSGVPTAGLLIVKSALNKS